ncbi:protein adenylyltransferase SelO, mitochondrial [[Candida] jaroonii]|uniref:Protein adenylyltransferase SelO, mitochondrial n=1 Tax=[Candida] jaroonii TaxID=467808 RepID=A0ACA9Y2T4_9ASCO|nr:protein adenylyltransferase SelO, mitochondrial [[Candida] jaroonii]
MKLINIPKTSSFLHLEAELKVTAEQALNHEALSHTPRMIESGAYAYVLPEKRDQYQYLTSSPNALRDLGIEGDETDETYQKIVSGEAYQDKEFVKKVPVPYSQAYAGWQFGQFAGQLGDGRVTNLFEIPKLRNVDFKNERFIKSDSYNRKKYEIQLKGSGMTPFSRFADGKAVLRSSIREYIISEHLNAIGIPTTRALALTYLPKTLARRHMAEKCAIVTRFAESWIRLGTFDLYRLRGDRKGIRQLSDYIINELFTVDDLQFPYLTEFLKIKPNFIDFSLSQYDKMYLEIVLRNATSTAKWQTYGFLNGVLNTDNTSILGLSMDYGPFQIMDKFDPDYSPNSEDHSKRYGYKNTPTAIFWNLTRLGEDLAELIGMNEEQLELTSKGQMNDGMISEWEEDIIKRATKVIEVAGEMYTFSFTKKYVEAFFDRLGLSHELISEDPDVENKSLIVPLLDMLKRVQCDYNLFFTKLENIDTITKELKFNNELFEDEELEKFVNDWLNIYKGYLSKNDRDTKDMKSYNPLFLPRGWILDEVIEHTQKTEGQDLSLLKKLEKMSFNPYDDSKWGDELKDVESRWLRQGDVDEQYSMMTCSCSS